jgi:hypothetical protein
MPETIPLKIYEIVGGPIWVAAEDGQKVYEKIVAAFRAGRAVQLSFANRGNLITTFLNTAIGQLYKGDYQEDFLRTNLVPVDITDEDKKLFDRVIENSKRFFANRPAYDSAWKEEVGDEEE